MLLRWLLLPLALSDYIADATATSLSDSIADSTFILSEYIAEKMAIASLTLQHAPTASLFHMSTAHVLLGSLQHNHSSCTTPAAQQYRIEVA